LHIHRLEDVYRQRERRAQGKPATPRVCVAFDHRRPRVPLEKEDRRFFSVRPEFGEVHLNYCVVGKHLLEIFQDDDVDECGDDNVRPQSHLSADVQLFLGPTMCEEEAAQKLQDFFEWLRASPLPARGWDAAADPAALCLGRLPVADLDRNSAAVLGLSEEEIVDKVADYQQICSLRVLR
jgi:hypothetical protein